MHSLKMRLTISGTVGVVALNLVLGGLIGGVILIWKLAVALWYQELAEQYAIPNLGKCPFHQKGQVLYSDGINPPDGMCGVAWQVIAPIPHPEKGHCAHGMNGLLREGGIRRS